MQTNKIDIKGLDKVQLLMALWKNTQPEYKGWGVQSFDYNGAKEAVLNYIDYYCGKPIKLDLSKDYIDNTFGYDRDAGDGKCQQIIQELKKNYNTN